MAKCETEIDVLKGEMEQYIWTFRWLWLINAGAIVWSMAARHWDVAGLGAVSAVVAIIGVGRARRGRKLVDRVRDVCLPQS